MTPFEFRTVPHVHVERGAAERFAAFAEPALGGARRIFFVTDKGVRGLGLLDGALASLAEAGVETAVYDGVVADPPEAVVLAGAEAAREFGADAIVGFGGGSPMDTAKLIALLCAGDQKLADMYGVNNATGPRLPLALVPTTSGTGSEVTPIAVVTTGETTKMGVNAPPLYADLAILDADLTLGLPHVLAFNADVSGEDYAGIAGHLGRQSSAAALIEECERIAEAVGIERRLTEVGVNHNDLPRLAEDAMLQTRLLVNNPREVSQDEALAIYERAL